MEKLKFSHKGGWCANFSHKGGGCASFAHHKVVCEIFAQGTIHPCKCEIGFFQMAITSLFQIQIEYRLKLWTPDFPSFETRYSTHEMNFGK